MPTKPAARAITTGQAVAAYGALRTLTTATTPGAEAPDFEVIMRAAETLDALSDVYRGYETAQSKAQSAEAIRDADGQYIPVRDPNGNELPGQWKLDIPKLNERLATLRAQTITAPACPLTRDDLRALSAGQTGYAGLVADILPLLAAQAPG